MDPTEEGWGQRNKICHCFQNCINLTDKELQKKMAMLECAGFALYIYVPSKLHPNQYIGEIYMIRTDARTELEPDEFTLAFAKNKISCPRCIKLIEKAGKLKNIPSGNLQDVAGVCDHCWKPVAKMQKLAELVSKGIDMKPPAAKDTDITQMLQAIGTEDATKIFERPEEFTNIISPRRQYDRTPKRKEEQQLDKKQSQLSHVLQHTEKSKYEQFSEKEIKQKGEKDKLKTSVEKLDAKRDKSKEKEDNIKSKYDQQKAKVETSKYKQEKLKRKEDKVDEKGDKLKEKEDKTKSKDDRMKAKVGDKGDKSKRKEDKSDEKEDRLKEREDKTKSKDDKMKAKVGDKGDKSKTKEDKSDEKKDRLKEKEDKTKSKDDKMKATVGDKGDKSKRKEDKSDEKGDRLKEKEDKTKSKDDKMKAKAEDKGDKSKRKEDKSGEKGDRLKEKEDKTKPIDDKIKAKAETRKDKEDKSKWMENKLDSKGGKLKEEEYKKKSKDNKGNAKAAAPKDKGSKSEKKEDKIDEIQDKSEEKGKKLKEKDKSLKDKENKLKEKEEKSINKAGFNELLSQIASEKREAEKRKKLQQEQELIEKKAKEAQRLKLQQLENEKKKDAKLKPRSRLRLKPDELGDKDDKEEETVSKTPLITDIIIGETIKAKRKIEQTQELENAGKVENKKPVKYKPREAKKSGKGISKQGKSSKTTLEANSMVDGVMRYALSDRTYIDKGWTMLPQEKVVRKVNLYRMKPAHPELDWFKHNKERERLFYDSGETLAEIDDSGRGRWFYRSGKLALDYYDAEEKNAGQRFVVYSTGTPDERGRPRPRTVLATFDYLGNGIVYDHTGKIRLKYNQSEGVILDRDIGPVSHWKWHTLNDPPVLQQVMIDTQMPVKDPKIMSMGESGASPRKPDDLMLAIEFDNCLKEKDKKTKKTTQNFKPFQIKMKALKINEYFSLRVLDQGSVYLRYRDGSANMKINIGMVLDHKVIVDTDMVEIGDVWNSMAELPACTGSIAGLQNAVAHARTLERLRALKERNVRGPIQCASVDLMAKATSRPLRIPLACSVTSHIQSSSNYKQTCSCDGYTDQTVDSASFGIS